MGGLAEKTPAMSRVRDAFATPFTFDASAGTASGCLYKADGKKMRFSERTGGYGGDHVRTANPPTADTNIPAKRVEGRSLYLGHFMSRHYGHFLLESLSSAWAVAETDDVDTYVFHPFVFGSQVPAFARDLLAAAGVDPARIHIIDGPTRLAEAVVPLRLFHINRAAHPRLLEVYARIAAALGPASKPCERIYVSRSKLGGDRRKVANEAAVETLFRARGFTILHPQEMTVAEQVPLFAGCRVIAGFSGSGLHNVVFAGPETTLIELGDMRSRTEPQRTQAVVNALSGVSARFVPFAPGINEREVDISAITAVLDQQGEGRRGDKGSASLLETIRANLPWAERGDDAGTPG